jgi:hypothetical protein
MEETTYSIAITYRDDENNTFVELGGAAWETRQEWNAAWDNIPVAQDDSACCIADKRDDDWDIVDDKIVDRETVEVLLGKPISQLIQESSVQHQAKEAVAETERILRGTRKE